MENSTFSEMIRQQEEVFKGQAAQIDFLTESLTDMALKMDTIGWEKVTGMKDNTGIGLDELKGLSSTLRDMVVTNPLMKRGAQLRFAYVFGKAISFVNMKPRVEKVVIDDPFNYQALFSTEGQEALCAARFTDGCIFILRNIKTNDIYRIPLDEIDALYTDPKSAERVWFIKRRYTSYNDSGADEVTEFYPVNTYKGPRKTRIKDTRVNNDYVMYYYAPNRQVGHVLGLPDAWAAVQWVIAYSDYLKNQARLVAAHSKIAFKIATNTKTGGANVAAQVSQPGQAGAAIMGPGTDMLPMPARGSEVSFENGRALASEVAAALGVSVVALLSDPGAAGSSYGSAQTLDSPTILGMTALQNSWKEFYETILNDIDGKGKKIEVKFPTIDSDPEYKQLASVAQAQALGQLYQEEAREKALDLLDIRNPKPGLPVPDEFNTAHLTPQDAAKQATAQAKATAAAKDPIAKQGNSGATGGNKSATDNSDRTDTQTTGINS